MRHLRSYLGPAAGEALRRWARHYNVAGPDNQQAVKVRVGSLRFCKSPDVAALISSSAATFPLRSTDNLRALLVLDARLAAALRGMVLHVPPAPLTHPLTLAEQGSAFPYRWLELGFYRSVTGFTCEQPWHEHIYISLAYLGLRGKQVAEGPAPAWGAGAPKTQGAAPVTRGG